MKFKFFVDVQSTVIERCFYDVETTTLKEAKAIMINMIDKEDYDNTMLVKSEIIEDTLTNIELESNDGEPTCNLYTNEGLFITDNIEL